MREAERFYSQQIILYGVNIYIWMPRDLLDRLVVRRIHLLSIKMKVMTCSLKHDQYAVECYLFDVYVPTISLLPEYVNLTMIDIYYPHEI